MLQLRYIYFKAFYTSSLIVPRNVEVIVLDKIRLKTVSAFTDIIQFFPAQKCSCFLSKTAGLNAVKCSPIVQVSV